MASADAPMKGIATLLEAFAKLRTERDVSLVLVTKPTPGGRTEQLIDAWFKAPDLAAQKKLAADIQVEAYTNNVPYVPTGQFVVPTAYRRNLDGIIVAPVVFLWNVEKK